MVRVISKMSSHSSFGRVASLRLPTTTLFLFTSRLADDRGIDNHVLDDDARVRIGIVGVFVASSSPRTGDVVVVVGGLSSSTHRGGRFRESVWVRSTRVDVGDGERIDGDGDGDDNAWTRRTGHRAGIHER